APAITLLCTVVVTLLPALWQKDSRQTAATALLGIGTALLFNLSAFLGERDALGSFGLRYLADTPALASNFVLLLGAALAVLVSWDQLPRMRLEHPEYYPLLLLSTLGAMVMVAAGDLVTLVLGLEIMSLAVYVLSALRPCA